MATYNQRILGSSIVVDVRIGDRHYAVWSNVYDDTVTPEQLQWKGWAGFGPADPDLEHQAREEVRSWASQNRDQVQVLLERVKGNLAKDDLADKAKRRRKYRCLWAWTFNADRLKEAVSSFGGALLLTVIGIAGTILSTFAVQYSTLWWIGLTLVTLVALIPAAIFLMRGFLGWLWQRMP